MSWVQIERRKRSEERERRTKEQNLDKMYHFYTTLFPSPYLSDRLSYVALAIPLFPLPPRHPCIETKPLSLNLAHFFKLCKLATHTTHFDSHLSLLSATVLHFKSRENRVEKVERKLSRGFALSLSFFPPTHSLPL